MPEQTSVWDNPDLKIGGDYVGFENVGDSVSGTIQIVRAHRFPDGGVVPQLFLVTDDGEEKTVTCGQIRLKVALADLRPETGDHISIKLSDIEKRTGGKTLKIFDVNVVKGNGAAPAVTAPAAAAPAVAPPVDPQAAAAALANLTPEQKAALGIA